MLLILEDGVVSLLAALFPILFVVSYRLFSFLLCHFDSVIGLGVSYFLFS